MNIATGRRRVPKDVIETIATWLDRKVPGILGSLMCGSERRLVYRVAISVFPNQFM